MFNQDKYLSVRWLKGGRAYPELDCFGIVNEVRRDLGLHEWPDFAGVTKDDGGLNREARKLMLSLQHCEPCEGAGVACYSGSTVTHVGVVVELNGSLHVAECNPKSNVSFTPVAQFVRRFVKVEFWK
ncbi:nitrite transporter [Citrobacter koseri]|uniref:nitrite transporter n=1 Tax=Citrobacter TaxID=544 RepID=UPI000CE6684E|nr:MULTISPECIES: nitrite transporter [Citrobacter]AVE59924.1 nitrite transporter [Citrobacter koseri]MDM3035213.1 nitrite transporter [Citrobacter sp. CK186]